MLRGATDVLLLTPADSAQAVAKAYTVSLLAMIPLAVAALAALWLRRAPAGTRVLVWRSAVLSLVLVYLGHAVPVHWQAWVVPSALATPLVSLGRLQVTTATDGPSTLIQLIVLAYWLGVVVVLAPLAAAFLRPVRGRPIVDPGWLALLDDVRRATGVRRRVSLLVGDDALVPMTRGILRPIVLLPAAALEWNDAQRRAVLLHEVGHVRAGDAFFSIVARVACALYWFHPGAWWVARGLRAECEFACDDRVLASGVRRSDYAELLIMASAQLTPAHGGGIAVAMCRHTGLRARLAAVLDTQHDIAQPARRTVLCAAALTIAVAGPMSTMQLAPTRDVLTTLMSDARWESRAYAVMGLAKRADSVAVARTAAVLDPSPRVRAWARYALGITTH